MLKFLRSSWGLLASIPPNRWAVYLTAAAGLLTALAPVVGANDLTSVAGLAAVVVVVRQWLVGWQNLEKAEAQNRLHELAMHREAAAAAEARAQATAPRGPSVKLPR